MRSRAVLIGTLAVAAFSGAVVGQPPHARADVVAYLLNVTVRPGYNFANADQALAYGNGVCDKIRGGEPFAQIVNDIKTDFNTSDEFQASYLVSQSAQELCPETIWQLRQSAAHYQPPPGS
jgi:hypothetical protein